MAAYVPMAMMAASTVAGAVQKNNAPSDAWDRQNQLVAAQQEQEAKRQRNLLEQSQASLRARMGAFGMGGEGGSADAILAGMAEQSAQDLADGTRISNLKLSNRRANLLDRGSSSGGRAENPLGVFQSFYGGGSE